ncbi:hypothetical protein QT327_21305 [Olivibacter sp. 47]|uniref:hypothetical protein n=1 Tax=Olivibacter sp. 47 TaxID=3056486 RepID=UPI0025A47CB1|nr:hypothetical protein [Olivibacter sp. 47]MDM8176854.1 hypothetical protein [Olivibacter sp. 47]
MFITRQDILTLIYGEKVDAISRQDEQLLTSAIAYGIEEVAGYMGRFDTATLLASADITQDIGDLLDPLDFETDPLEDVDDDIEPLTLDNRDPLLLGLVKVCAAWQFIAIANVGVDYAVIQDRYEKAIETLKLIQSGKLTPRNWPPKPVNPSTGVDPSQVFIYGSNPRRRNHF